MRLRVEFTTEPFDLDEAPPHALVAREVIEAAELDAVDVGPFGNTAEGDADAVLTAVDALLRRALAAGATRVSLQVNAVGEGESLRVSETTPSSRRSSRWSTPWGEMAAPTGPAPMTSCSPGRVWTWSPYGCRSWPTRSITSWSPWSASRASRWPTSTASPSRRSFGCSRPAVVFSVRHGVETVASALGVSRFTVYNDPNREKEA